MDNQSNVSLGCHNKILKFVSETMASVLGRFSFATATENGSNNENTVKNTAFWLLVWKKVVFREGNCQGNRKLCTDPA